MRKIAQSVQKGPISTSNLSMTQASGWFTSSRLEPPERPCSGRAYRAGQPYQYWAMLLAFAEYAVPLTNTSPYAIA